MHIGAERAQLAAARAEHVAVADSVGPWSFQRFYSRLARFGNAMRGLGLRKGDRIARLLPENCEYLEVDYGTMAAGLVRVPLDPRLTRTELAGLLRFAGV